MASARNNQSLCVIRHRNEKQPDRAVRLASTEFRMEPSNVEDGMHKTSL
jgi:hypothetical protein